MKRFVIDASILVKLFFEEDHSDASVRHVKQADELLAPELLWVEVANVVWKRHRRGEITAADAAGLLEEMLRVPIVTHTHAGLVTSALSLASETGRTVYDCLYLALAISHDIPVLTGDEKLANGLTGGTYARRVRFVGKRV
jgi:predicted nucleic acid-binding protein